MTLTSPEAAQDRRPEPRRAQRSPAVAVVAAIVLAAAVHAGDPFSAVNTGGLSQVRRFFAAAVRPDLSGEFLALAWREALVTLAYAVLGTALAMVLGLLGALVLARRWWTVPGSDRIRPGWQLVRALAVLPRSVHEVVWGLLLLNVLGLDPFVAVLAIGVPFGAITAKVFADAIDDADGATFAALRAAGAGRLAALVYGIGPAVRDDLVSYGFYRFECSIRSAAILGIVGAGGLGFQLQLSFTSLRYGEVWTLLWALVLLNGAADAWSGWVRHRAPSVLAADGARQVTGRRRSTVLATGVVLVPGVVSAWWWLGLTPASLWSDRTRRQLAYLGGEMFPPSLRDGWGTIVEQSLDTLALSVLAIALSFAGATVIALIVSGAIGPAGRLGVAMRASVRFLLLVTRAIPPPVWAIVALFVLYPGPWPGAVALAVYNLGVLGRLLGESLENIDQGPALALQAAGASRTSAAAYTTVPEALGRFVSLGLYRWEVTIRETVVVGVVGAGGLGRALDEELSSFAWSKVTGIVLALVVITFVVDAASARLRRRAG